jgi:hypothetical protein
MIPDPADYYIWLATNPPPNLQKLVAQYGGLYANITPEAWAKWDNAVETWEAARRDRLLGSHTWAMMKGKKYPK